MFPVILALQALHMLFLALHDWVSLPPLNDVQAVRAADPVRTLLTTTAVSTLPYVVGLVGTAACARGGYPRWLDDWLWWSYGLLLAGELRAW